MNAKTKAIRVKFQLEKQAPNEIDRAFDLLFDQCDLSNLLSDFCFVNDDRREQHCKCTVMGDGPA